ncbi:DUF551 domain-containing protein [Klebsiella quasipneumoniae]|uniref:DUF551 domain-containing protein n=1 Tax=Klebsiella quasipneumoniae TaxID=1463165 RepID=UPI00217D6C8F|nr:DUF551 domain-containing protein [Klebsiella quasipneumoniae]MCS6403964.1 DUF551 domain-containing protein [Klebsiella quasipneumoniae subsp. quasipneumoniae]
MTKSTITREQAEEAIDGLEGLISRGVQSVYLDIAIAGLRQLVPAMDQKPALHRYRRKAVEPYGPYPWHYEVFVDYPQPFEDIEDEYFYAAPPVVTGFAVDGESECLPLDYLQGHKDGLEWAAQLAEANHPETGDWLYDDPIELAKAIRKGPDMPPVQPVADSEPDRNPVLAYADSYRDMAKQGVESVPIWSVITDLERNIAPLYRHAQPALVIPDEMTAEQAYEIGYYYGDPVNVFARGANWMRQHIIDSTLAAAQHDTPALNSVQSVVTVPGKWIPVSERMPEVGVKVLCFPAEDEPIHAVFNGQLWLQDVSWSGSEEPIDNVIPVTVTHWMPLPAGPQEVR